MQNGPQPWGTGNQTVTASHMQQNATVRKHGLVNVETIQNIAECQ